MLTLPPPSKSQPVIRRLDVKMPWMSQEVLERLKEQSIILSLNAPFNRTD